MNFCSNSEAILSRASAFLFSISIPFSLTLINFSISLTSALGILSRYYTKVKNYDKKNYENIVKPFFQKWAKHMSKIFEKWFSCFFFFILDHVFQKRFKSIIWIYFLTLAILNWLITTHIPLSFCLCKSSIRLEINVSMIDVCTSSILISFTKN